MRILLLSHRVPFPLNDGGAIGLDYFITGYLNAGAKLSMLSLNTSKHFVDVKQLPSYYNSLEVFETVYVDNRIKPVSAFLNLFTSHSYNAIRFYTKDFEDVLIKLLQTTKYDIIHLDSIYLGHYINTIRIYSKAKIACRIHNIEHKIWERLAENASNPLKKWYLNLLTKRLKKFEADTLNHTDSLLTIAEEDTTDLKAFSVNTFTYLLPFGIDTSKINYHASEGINCFHIGSMDWIPNIEGINWFLKEVWPLVHQMNPIISCHLAGKKMKIEDFPRLEGVVYHGEVNSSEEFIKSHNVMIVPILSGDGIRVKILEALAQGKKIVSTSLGARGIQVKQGESVYIANQAKSFAESIIKAIQENDAMNKAARKLVESQYDKTEIFENALKHYQKLIA
jgi:polysaccharide biosynthesis protein PslH